VPLAYYSRAATAEFWSEHWGGQSVEALLRIARVSPLTAVIERHLPRAGRVLEAGCGVGQYVLLLRERGWRAVGVDWSMEAAAQGACAGAPLAAMDLRRLAMRDGAAAAYLSLGVVEHDPDGPDAIVAEAARVLAPGGTILLSVPYWNGVRRLAAPWLAWRGRRVRRSGGEFYQFAFTRREVRAFLEGHGFVVRGFHPYDPARILRKAFQHLAGRGARAAGGGAGESSAPVAGGWRGAARRLLYTELALRSLGHMILAVASKADHS
jgi:SAM-dependent methyltransferase